MALKPELWTEIKVLYEATNKTLRDIAIELSNKGVEINYSSIAKKAKKDGWIQGQYQQLIAEKVEHTSMLQKANNNIQQKFNKEELPIVKSLIDERLEHLGILNDTMKIANKLQKNITIMTANKLKNGEYEPHQAAAILSTQGLKVSDIAKLSGIDTVQPQQEDDPDDVIRIIG